MKSLRIQYLSDIHTEFVGAHGIDGLLMRIEPKAPVLVLAGDVGACGTPEYDRFLTEVSKKFEHTFFIHGNHEYYRRSAMSTSTDGYETAVLCSKMLEQKNPNLHFLHNSTYDLPKDATASAAQWRFIGSTLWSRIESKEHLINDFDAIPWMFPEYCNYIHKKSRAFIKKEIERAKRDNVTPIVITHHLPSYELVDPKYAKYGKFNQCFASRSDDLIDGSVAAWIYGHTHDAHNRIWSNGRTQMACNPVGYPGERAKVDYGKTLSVFVEDDEGEVKTEK